MKKSLIALMAAVSAGATMAPLVGNAQQNTSTDASATFTAGALTLNSVPGNFQFGTVPISNAVQKIAVNGGTGISKTQITDLRGTTKGYRLTVQADVMTSNTDSTVKLNGNNITLENALAEFTGNPTTDQSVKDAKPNVKATIFADQLGTDNATVPAEVVTAVGEQGQYTWDTKWNNSDINLTVQPSEVTASAYHTTLNWVLSDIPTQTVTSGNMNYLGTKAEMESFIAVMGVNHPSGTYELGNPVTVGGQTYYGIQYTPNPQTIATFGDSNRLSAYVYSNLLGAYFNQSAGGMLLPNFVAAGTEEDMIQLAAYINNFYPGTNATVSGVVNSPGMLQPLAQVVIPDLESFVNAHPEFGEPNGISENGLYNIIYQAMILQ